ncbi:MAG: hypothetical protein PHG97_00650, partial [Candidatus Margulisbacteria bacterium]|nr:hypothetical protein [Candidatus Margulisiibacteriota bacterium]
PQFIYIIAPFLFIVFSIAVFYLLEKYQKAAAVILLVIFLPALISLPRAVSLFVPERPGESMVSVLNYYRQGLLTRYPLASAVNLQHLNSEGIAFHFWDWNAPVLADPAISPDEMFRNSRYFLTVTLDTNSPYQSDILDDSLFLWNGYLADKQRLGEIREFSARRFERIGLTATIYEKNTAQ